MPLRVSNKEARKLGLQLPGSTRKPTGRRLLKAAVEQRQDAKEAVFLAACEAHGLPEPVSEYQFCPGRKFRADWLFDGWLILEIQGGIYGRGEACPACGRKPVGAHSSIKDLMRDIERQRLAVLHGYAVIGCLPEEVEDGSIFPIILAILESEAAQS